MASSDEYVEEQEDSDDYCSDYVEEQEDSDDYCSDYVEEQEDSDDYCSDSHLIQKNPVHNPHTPWNLMKPILREKYESHEQLKFCLTNYAVSNGYQLYYARCCKKRLLVECGRDKNGSSKCTFRLYASWTYNKRWLQIKKLEEKHVCTRSNNFGNAILNSNWIAKHYVKDLIIYPRMKSREMQEDVLKRFSCDVSLRQCFRAKAIAMAMIDGGGLSDERKRHVIEEDEEDTCGRTVVCNNCLQKGHNMRSCKNPKQNRDPKVKKKLGRPRIHENVMRASRTCLGRNTGAPWTKKKVASARYKVFVAETKDCELLDEPIDQENMQISAVDDMEVQESQQDIVCETQVDETPELIKTMKESGYTSSEIEETLAEEKEEEVDGTQPTVCTKKRRRSERIVKIKLSTSVYDEDGGGSCVEKAITLD